MGSSNDDTPFPNIEQPDAAESRSRIGHYEVMERIGVGGMAEAFRARARGPGGYQRELIIKRILPHFAHNTEFIRAFVDEARILGLVNHPNVVGAYDFGEDQGHHFLALEYLDGPSLAALIARARRSGSLIPAGIAAYCVQQVCQGLSAVHTLKDFTGRSLGVIHRDVTPANIMTTRRGAVKLLDFGIAKIATSDQVTRQGHIKGKAGYLAPEQIRGARIDARVDLFALGVVLHETLCLEHLFYGEGGDLATIYRIVELPIPPPRTLRADVPSRLDAIVMKALMRSPDERYSSAAEMAHDLETVVQETGVRTEGVVAFIASD